jgi:pimeloyl-ACP methyl ester carboxylesterase
MPFSPRIPSVFDWLEPQGSATSYIARLASVFAVLGFIAWLALIAFLRKEEASIVFRAGSTHWQDGTFDTKVFQTVKFATADGLKLDGVRSAIEVKAPSYWILFCVASGATIRDAGVQRQLQKLSSLGYGVMTFDYRGFGRNPGTPTEAGVYADALAAYRYLTQEYGVRPSRVILAGRSLGSAVAVETATRVPAAGLVLLSPIDSVPLTGARAYWWIPVRRLATYRFDNVVKIEHVSVPVLVVHATDDELVPVRVARDLFARISARRLMIETDGGHNDAGFGRGGELADALRRLWPPT